MKSRNTKTAYLFYLLALIILVAGVVFWTSDLTSDPPMYYSGLGQSLATDPSQYVFHARNNILFGEWDPYDYPRWTIYQHSLTSLAAYLWFAVNGVSLKQANAVGIILNLGGLLFFVLGLTRHHRPWVTAVVAFCYTINVTLLTYGRLPYLENGLIFTASVFFFVYSWWGSKTWGIALAGLLVALATLTGKLFGALLLPALVLAIFFSGRADRLRRSLVAIGACLVTGTVLILVLYSGDVVAAFTYVGEQSYGLRGFPAGLSSPWGFLEHLVSYGYRNRMFYLGPDLFVFILISGLLLILFPRGRDSLTQFSPATILALCWVASVILGLMPLNYSPLRYALFLIPAMIICCFTLVDRLLDRQRFTAIVPGKIRTALLALLFWFALYHVIGNVVYFNNTPYRALTWATLPGGIGLALLTRFLLTRRRISFSRFQLVVGLLLAIGLSATVNGFRIRRAHYLDHNYNLLEANEDIQHILGPGAVVSGPYGPVLTMDNDVNSFIHLFGVAEVDSTLFDRQPITHLAMDASNFWEAAGAFPQLDSMKLISTIWIRDVKVNLYNISKLFSNPGASGYQESHYEKAATFVQEGNLDNALTEIRLHLESNPMTKSSGLLLANLLWKKRQVQEALRLMTTLADRYRTDFYVQMQCGHFYLFMAMANKNESLMSAAKTYFERGIKANRFKTDFANKLVTDTRRTFQSQPQPTTP